MTSVQDGMEWTWLDSGAGDPDFNMALDEALLDHAPDFDRPVLRFYGWNVPAASFGYFQNIAAIERATPLRPLVRRPTGGGLVPHDADWTYSVVIPPGYPWYELRATESYQRVHEWIRDSFGLFSVPTELAPCCCNEIPGQCFAGYEKFDVLWMGRKIAGAAQRRTKNGLLVQGSIQPQPRPVTRAQWQSAMLEVARSRRGVRWTLFELKSGLLEHAEALRAEKFSQDTHNRRR
jgi:lipoate-protein ligase A